MKIAIDVDDCICNSLEWDFACAWYYNKKNHPDDKNFYYTIFHSAPEIFKFSSFETEKFYTQQRKFLIEKKLLYPKPFVKEVLDNLLKNGDEIYILTSREDKYWNNDAKRETQKWLKKYKINYTSLIANCLEKGLKCAELKVDLLIDDNPKYIQQVNAQGIRTIILSAPYNLKYKNILNTHASCWPEVYQIIQDLKISLENYKKSKIEKEKQNKGKLTFIAITNKTLINAVRLQQRITKKHCAYLTYKEAINSKNPYYFVYNNDQAIGITGFYVLKDYPEDAWLGIGGIVPSNIRQGFGNKVLKFIIDKAKEKGFKNFRILTSFVENPTSQTLFRQYSDICELYQIEGENKITHYIYSKSLTEEPVSKWGNKDCGFKDFCKQEKESKKIMKDKIN